MIFVTIFQYYIQLIMKYGSWYFGFQRIDFRTQHCNLVGDLFDVLLVALDSLIHLVQFFRQLLDAVPVDGVVGGVAFGSETVDFAGEFVQFLLYFLLFLDTLGDA